MKSRSRLKILTRSRSRRLRLLVDTKSKIPLLNHQNRIETTVSAHTRKRQHKRLRIASVSSNIGVPNLSLTMYPFSILTDEHVSLQHFNRYVPLQHFDRCTCTGCFTIVETKRLGTNPGF